MRVTQVNKYYSPPHLGGIEVVVRRLSEGLVAMRGRRVRGARVQRGRERVEETIGGVRGRASAEAPQGLLGAGGRGHARRPAPRLRGPAACDILHLHSPYPWGELSFLMARPDVPSVVLYHSDIVRQRGCSPRTGRSSSASSTQSTSSWSRRPTWCVHSPFLAPRAAQVPSRALSGCPRSASQRRRDAQGARAGAARGSTTGRRIVLFVGRLVYYKGVDVLVRAMADVDADLVLIGDGPLEGAHCLLARKRCRRVVDASSAGG